jgi:hypothetical protein
VGINVNFEKKTPMNLRLKNIIKNKLSEDLSSVSIINYNGSIWFIDPKSKYWYLELYKKTKTLWWRLDFFEDFFILFGMEQREFVPIIIEWVEEVLNSRVYITKVWRGIDSNGVEEVLKGDVVSTWSSGGTKNGEVEEVLDGKILSTVGNLPPSQVMVEKILGEVVSTQGTPASFRMEVGEVLKGEVVSTHDSQLVDFILGEKVLKGEVVSTRRQKLRQEFQVEEILNTKGFSHDFVQEALVQDLIKNMIETTTPDSNSDYSRVEDALNSI